ncbi:MAG: PEP-CTERM sorting domain-containing protein [Bryobacteraceae bacterium]
MSRFVSGVLPLAAAVLMAGSAQGAPIGILSVDSCAGTVRVDATSIDFTPQCVQAGSPTTITSTFGNIITGDQGTINDLVGPLPLGGVPFMIFDPGAPGGGLLTFILTSVGPGSANTNCATATPSNGCSVIAGSPFILTGNAASTTARLEIAGTVSDSSGLSTFVGSFSAPFAGQSPAQVAAMFASAGSITSTFSGQLILTAVPEPGGLALMGLGLLGVGLVSRRRFKASA